MSQINRLSYANFLLSVCCLLKNIKTGSRGGNLKLKNQLCQLNFVIVWWKPNQAVHTVLSMFALKIAPKSKYNVIVLWPK